MVRIYTQDYELVATHDRAGQVGARSTHPDHLPPEKLDGLYGDRASCQAVAQDIGPAAAEVVASLLADPMVDRLATARRLLKLRQKYNDQRLEAVCHRALRFGDPSYMTVKRILENGQEQQPLHPPLAAPAPAHAFIRNATELFGDLLGGLRWT